MHSLDECSGTEMKNMEKKKVLTFIVIFSIPDDKEIINKNMFTMKQKERFYSRFKIFQKSPSR